MGSRLLEELYIDNGVIVDDLDKLIDLANKTNNKKTFNKTLKTIKELTNVDRIEDLMMFDNKNIKRPVELGKSLKEKEKKLNKKWKFPFTNSIGVVKKKSNKKSNKKKSNKKSKKRTI